MAAGTSPGQNRIPRPCAVGEDRVLHAHERV